MVSNVTILDCWITNYLVCTLYIQTRSKRQNDLKDHDIVGMLEGPFLKYLLSSVSTYIFWKKSSAFLWEQTMQGKHRNDILCRFPYKRSHIIHFMCIVLTMTTFHLYFKCEYEYGARFKAVYAVCKSTRLGNVEIVICPARFKQLYKNRHRKGCS